MGRITAASAIITPPMESFCSTNIIPQLISVKKIAAEINVAALKNPITDRSIQKDDYN